MASDSVIIAQYFVQPGSHTVILFCSLCIDRLTGSFVPDLIVSMTHQMWLHLQSDESVGSIGFKINYKGESVLCLNFLECHHKSLCRLKSFTAVFLALLSPPNRNWQGKLRGSRHPSVRPPRGRGLLQRRRAALWMPVRIRAHRRTNDFLSE